MKKEEGVPSGLSVDEENVSGVCVRESFMEEKAAAVDAIGGIAQHTGAAFVKFLKPAHSALSSLMTFVGIFLLFYFFFLQKKKWG